jgi:hypothetical protein
MSGEWAGDRYEGEFYKGKRNGKGIVNKYQKTR